MINTITVGASPVGVAVTPDGADVYVANNDDGTVSEIRTSDNTVINTITVGTTPQGVAVTPNGADLYVTNSTSGTVSVQGLLPQTSPTAGSAGFGTAFSGQLAVSASSGTVTYATTVTSPNVSVSGAGAITAPTSTPPGVYTASGTDSDTTGDVGTWTFTLTVNQAATTTSVSSSGSPSTRGGQVTYTATIAPAPDGGTVSFSDGLTAITGCATQTVTSGAATCVVSYADTGSHSITAVYAGDSNYFGSSSSALTQTVAATPTTTTTTPTPTPTPAPTPTPSVLSVARQTIAVTTRGALKVKVTCSDSVCTGTLKLTARITRTTGKGKHRRTKATTVTIATVSLSQLTVQAHSASLTLNKAGVRLLRTAHYKLSATATITYKSGSTSKTTHAAVTLRGTMPKPPKAQKK